MCFVFTMQDDVVFFLENIKWNYDRDGVGVCKSKRLVEKKKENNYYFYLTCINYEDIYVSLYTNKND